MPAYSRYITQSQNQWRRYLAAMRATIPLWKQAPFLRLILPFISGILLQYYTANPPIVGWIVLSGCGFFLISFFFTGLKWRYTCRHLQGIAVNLLLTSAGCLACHFNNPYTARSSLESMISDSSIYTVSLLEPPLVRTRSWRSLASIERISHSKESGQTSCKLFLYFIKDSNSVLPGYGSKISFTKALRPIRNYEGLNGFDYERYCALKNIHYQVFLSADEYSIEKGSSGNELMEFVFRLQDHTIRLLKTYIAGEKECGLALALLIGFKNELDRNLVSAYSNTGVVHVIAISGLHLGIIYAILQFLCLPLRRTVALKWMSPLLVTCGLWLFTFLAGASPSVLRSAVMFTGMVAGESVCRHSGVLNSLFASAFFLLCYDPFWLWDLGLVLSYTALLGIIIFNKPIYQAANFTNRLADGLWKMVSITLSAQILTMPVIFLNFHQFPVMFLVANLVAIPLSSGILIGEILLCVVSFIPGVAELWGTVLTIAIRAMNQFIGYVDKLPFSSVSKIDINVSQALLMYVFIALMGCWLILKRKKYLPAALVTAITFLAAGP